MKTIEELESENNVTGLFLSLLAFASGIFGIFYGDTHSGYSGSVVDAVLRTFTVPLHLLIIVFLLSCLWGWFLWLQGKSGSAPLVLRIFYTIFGVVSLFLLSHVYLWFGISWGFVALSAVYLVVILVVFLRVLRYDVSAEIGRIPSER